MHHRSVLGPGLGSFWAKADHLAMLVEHHDYQSALWLLPFPHVGYGSQVHCRCIEWKCRHHPDYSSRDGAIQEPTAESFQYHALGMDDR